MPLEPAVIEAPVKEPSLGDKFRAEFAKIEPKEEAPTTEPEVKAEPEAKVEPEVKAETPVLKPSSPLDALLGKEKLAEKSAESEDDKILAQPLSEKEINWNLARKKIEILEGREKSVRDELSKSKAEPKVDTNELEAIKAEREQLKERIAKNETNLKAINAEYSEDFQSLLKERDNKLQKIETRAKSYGVDPDMLLSALAMRDGKFKTQQIKEALAEVDSDDKARIHTLIESLEETSEKITDFRKDLPAKFDELQAKREAQQRMDADNNLKTLTSEFGKIADELPKDVVTLREVSDDIEGAAEWNAAIRGAKERALNALKPGGSDFRHTGEIALKGEHYDDLYKYAMKLHAENAQFRTQQRETDVSSPDFKGGTSPKAAPDLKPADKYRKALAGLQGAED